MLVRWREFEDGQIVRVATVAPRQICNQWSKPLPTQNAGQQLQLNTDFPFYVSPSDLRSFAFLATTSESEWSRRTLTAPTALWAEAYEGADVRKPGQR